MNKPEEALQDANVCFIFTELAEIKAVTPADYKQLMKPALVYDGRRRGILFDWEIKR